MRPRSSGSIASAAMRSISGASEKKESSAPFCSTDAKPKRLAALRSSEMSTRLLTGAGSSP